MYVFICVVLYPLKMNKYNKITNFRLILTVKKLGNWSRFNEVIRRTKMCQIFWATVE